MCFIPPGHVQNNNSMSGPYTYYICYQYTETGFSSARNINAGVD